MANTKRLVIKGIPRSKKNNKQIIYARGRPMLIPSKAYKEYQEEALRELKKYKVKKPFLKVAIDYEFCFKGNPALDVDNCICSINDILQDAGILQNDRYVVSGTFEMLYDQDENETIINIHELQD